MSFDIACLKIAERFLAGEEWATVQEENALASYIQKVIEDWIAAKRPPDVEPEFTDSKDSDEMLRKIRGDI